MLEDGQVHSTTQIIGFKQEFALMVDKHAIEITMFVVGDLLCQSNNHLLITAINAQLIY